MPFDAAGFDWRGRPEPDRNFWEVLNDVLFEFASLLAWAAIFGIFLIPAVYVVAFATHAIAYVTGNGLQCVAHGLFPECH